MSSPELLSPAGNLDKLKIAIDYGADAVYGSYSHFSLRNKSAKEFTRDTFGEGINYAHNLGRKVYATVNGFPFDSQLDKLEEHLESLKDLNVDGLIIASPGVLKLAKKIAPNIDIHLSTQANVLNKYDAEVYYDLGVKRIVAAREASLKDLESIKNHLPDLELEIFVHGSMCFSYSGRCLISSLQTGRVSNRGSCANDCRFNYEMYIKDEKSNALIKLEEDSTGTYVLNAKDLNLSKHMKEIVSAGIIDSLKIEGRTKSEYYVAITTKTYRQILDDIDKKEYNTTLYEYELNTLKNRGYTDGYIFNRPFEREDTQNLERAISESMYEVVGKVEKDGKSFMCKYKTYPNDLSEIISPDNTIEEVRNDIGEIYKNRVDNRHYMRLFKIVTEDGKELESVHSGNLNKIVLPGALSKNTFFRRKVREEI